MNYLSGFEKIKFKIGNIDYSRSINDAWELLSSKYEVFRNEDHELIKIEDIFVYDVCKYVKGINLIKHKRTKEWCLVELENGNSLTVTLDNHWKVNSNIEKKTIDLVIGDTVTCEKDGKVERSKIVSLELLPILNMESYSIETESLNVLCSNIRV